MRNLTKRQEDALHAISNFLNQYVVHQYLFELKTPNKAFFS